MTELAALKPRIPANLESGRRLSVPPELRDHLERITEMVAEHYQAHHGEVVLWGKIDRPLPPSRRPRNGVSDQPGRAAA